MPRVFPDTEEATPPPSLQEKLKKAVKGNWYYLFVTFGGYLAIVSIAFKFPKEPSTVFFELFYDTVGVMGLPTIIGLICGAFLEMFSLISERYFNDTWKRREKKLQFTVYFAISIWFFGAYKWAFLKEDPSFGIDNVMKVFFISLGLGHAKFGILVAKIYPNSSILLQMICVMPATLIVILVSSLIGENWVFDIFRALMCVLFFGYMIYFEQKIQKDLKKINAAIRRKEDMYLVLATEMAERIAKEMYDQKMKDLQEMAANEQAQHQIPLAAPRPGILARRRQSGF